MKYFGSLFACILSVLLVTQSALADYEKNKIAVLPFSLQGENFETDDMGTIVAEWLITAFVKDGRFEVVERKLLGKILEEQQMAEAGLVSQETASEIGRLLGVKVIISGSVMKLRDIIEVNSRIIDVTSASIVTAENVRSNKVTDLQSLVIQMADKIMKNFPLEGYIANRNGEDVVVDLGELAGVKPGMKFMVYKEGDVVRHPKTDEILYVKKNQTGTIEVITVQQKISEGIILDEVHLGAIEYGDFVKSINAIHEDRSERVYTPEPVQSKESSSNIAVIEPIQTSTRKETAVPKPPVSKFSPEIKDYLNKLNGFDTKQRRWAAKKLYRTEPYSAALLKEVNRILLRGYNSDVGDKNHADAMAWLCRLLANSKDSQYKSTLQEVVNRTTSPKIKKHAQKALRQF